MHHANIVHLVLSRADYTHLHIYSPLIRTQTTALGTTQGEKLEALTPIPPMVHVYFNPSWVNVFYFLYEHTKMMKCPQKEDICKISEPLHAPGPP